MLAVENLSYAVAGRFLLKDIAFDLYPGELLAVVGPNGAGKSTLLKLLCGDLSPLAGRVALDGRPLTEWSALEQARRRALLPQASTLAFPFIAFEVVLMGRNPHSRGASSPHDQQVVRSALKRTRAFHLAAREYPTLSGGEQQRVQLARVLAQVWDAPEAGERYLFLDEPTNNLDLAHQHGTLGLAKRFAQEGAGVLAVLHDLNLAAQYADRILMLCGGEVQALGVPDQVLVADSIEAAFGLSVLVTRHPISGCPLIVSAAGSEAAGWQEPVELEA